jgi:hypothetical protein
MKATLSLAGLHGTTSTTTSTDTNGTTTELPPGY